MEVVRVGDTKKRVLGDKRRASPFASTLTDLSTPVFSYAFQLRRMKDPGAPEALRAKLDELFRQFETSARVAGIPQADVRSAEYALVAYLDELILTSTWPLKDAWMGKPLQLEMFNDFSAGEEFYTTVDGLRHSTDARKLDLLEVYFTALSLGFRGKFADTQGQERRKILIDNLSREIANSRGSAAATLSPKADPGDDLPEAVKRFPLWAAVALGIAWCIGLFLFLSMLLGGQAAELAKGGK